MSIPKEEEEAIANALIDNAMAGCVFPADIMLSILTRLPAKSIQRFKFVSKLWSKLFSNPKFIKMYKGMFSIDPNNESVFFAGRAKVGSTISSVYLINPDSNEKELEPSIVQLPLSKCEIFSGRVEFFACCNGLICMQYDDVGSTIALWNPAMEWYKIVSNESHVIKYGETASFGFGYDAGGDDFKVVRLVCMADPEDDGGTLIFFAEVYSFNSETWTTIGVNLKFGVEIGSKLTVNGNPYWFVDNSVEDYEKLVYFDVKVLDFKFVPLPPLFHSKGLRLVDWKGTLGTLQFSHGEDKKYSYLEVCVFDDSQITWRYILRIGPFRGIEVGICMQPFKNGNIMLYKKGEWFVFYHESRSVKKIMIRADDDRYGSDSFDIFGYTATLKGC